MGTIRELPNFDGNGHFDLAVGAPWYNVTGVFDAGGVVVLYGGLFADGFEIETTERWSNSFP